MLQRDGQASIDGLTPIDILRRSAETYATLHSYEDRGTVTMVVSRQQAQQLRFEILFGRPDLLHYQYVTPDPLGEPGRYVAWSDGNRVRSWSTHRGQISEIGSLEEVVDDLLMASGNSSVLILALLLGKGYEGSWLESTMGNAQAVGEEVVAGEPCFWVQRVGSAGEWTEWPPSPCIRNPGNQRFRDVARVVWISKKDFMIRRISERTISEWGSRRFTSETVVASRPSRDVRVSPERFRFTPPKP